MRNFKQIIAAVMAVSALAAAAPAPASAFDLGSIGAAAKNFANRVDQSVQRAWSNFVTSDYNPSKPLRQLSTSYYTINPYVFNQPVRWDGDARCGSTCDGKRSLNQRGSGVPVGSTVVNKINNTTYTYKGVKNYGTLRTINRSEH